MKINVQGGVPGGHECPHCHKINTSRLTRTDLFISHVRYTIDVTYLLWCDRCNRMHDVMHKMSFEQIERGESV